MRSGSGTNRRKEFSTASPKLAAITNKKKERGWRKRERAQKNTTISEGIGKYKFRPRAVVLGVMAIIGTNKGMKGMVDVPKKNSPVGGHHKQRWPEQRRDGSVLGPSVGGQVRGRKV